MFELWKVLKKSLVKNYLGSLIYSYLQGNSYSGYYHLLWKTWKNLQMNLDMHNLNIGHKCELHNPNSLTPTKYQQHKQCTYNVILRRVRVTIVAVEKVLHILSVCL